MHGIYTSCQYPRLALSYPGDSAYIPAGGTSTLRLDMYLEDLKDKWSDRHVMYAHTSTYALLMDNSYLHPTHLPEAN